MKGDNNMKKTLIFTEPGDTYLTVVWKPGEVTQRDIKLHNTLYFAEIAGNSDNAFWVRFHIPFFKKFNKGGFISKQSACNYIQDILDGYFDDYISYEYFESGIA